MVLKKTVVGRVIIDNKPFLRAELYDTNACQYDKLYRSLVMLAYIFVKKKGWLDVSKLKSSDFYSSSFTVLIERYIRPWLIASHILSVTAGLTL